MSYLQNKNVEKSYSERRYHKRKLTKNSDGWISKKQSFEIEESSDENNGSDIPCGPFTLWAHDLQNKNWKPESYTNVCTINNISDMWRVINNFDKLGVTKMHLFLMRYNIEPRWEDINNRDGGVCTFKTDISKYKSIVKDISLKFMTNNLCDDNEDINGISISPKNNWMVIKIWNKNSTNDLTETLYSDILQKYENLNPKYRPTKPEY